MHTIVSVWGDFSAYDCVSVETLEHTIVSVWGDFSAYDHVV